MSFKKLQDVDVKGKRVLLRVDYNVALNGDKVVEAKRIEATIPTLRYLIEQGAKIIIMSHLGRPKGTWNVKYSLKPVMTALEEMQRRGELPASKCSFWSEDFRSPELISITKSMQPGEILFIENLRFDPGEEKNDLELAKALAALGDIFVQEAFGAVHRAHASTAAIAQLLPKAFGFLVQKELEMLGKMLDHPEHPFIVLLGGVKVSDKIGTIENLLKRGADKILIGGAMSYTFLKAKGFSTGGSLVEKDWVEKSKELLARYPGRILVAQDHWAAPATGKLPTVEDAKGAKLFPNENIEEGWAGYDIGPKTIEVFKKEIAQAKTIFWNGPLGLMEVKPFDKGSAELASAIAQATQRRAMSVLGGGDTIYAVSLAGLSEENFTHVSTGGGATLEFLEGKALPGLTNGSLKS